MVTLDSNEKKMLGELASVFQSNSNNSKTWDLIDPKKDPWMIKTLAALGEDPLRDDADPDAEWNTGERARGRSDITFSMNLDDNREKARAPRSLPRVTSFPHSDQ